MAISEVPATTVWTLQYAPDGHTLAATAGNIHLWDTEPRRAVQRVCRHAGDPVSETERAKTIPGEPCRKVCP